jgi:hypothetical protein
MNTCELDKQDLDRHDMGQDDVKRPWWTGMIIGFTLAERKRAEKK